MFKRKIFIILTSKFTMIHDQRDANQNHNEILCHTLQSGKSRNVRQYTVLERVWCNNYLIDCCWECNLGHHYGLLKNTSYKSFLHAVYEEMCRGLFTTSSHVVPSYAYLCACTCVCMYEFLPLSPVTTEKL